MPAAYSDWELHSTQLSDLTAARTYFGFTQGDGFTADGVRYTINLYGQKFLPSKTQTFVDAFGNTRPLMVAQPGYYAILRWFSDKPFPPPNLPLPNRVTAVSPIPDDSPVVFAPV